MAVSMREVDPVFQGVGQKTGLEIWRIENFRPVSVPPPSHGNFFTGDSYVILKTTALKSGAFRHDIHYWIGKDTSQDEASTAAIKTVELDAALGGRAVQYREIQGYETEKFLSYFKPCIIPQSGSVASGFKHAEENELEYETRLYVCRGKHVVYVKEVPFVRTSLSHDDIFILDTKHKVFQFNGCNTSIQERAKALEVVQYIKDTYHGGKCDVATVEDGKLMADLEAGEFWGFFGGFAPLPRKAVMDEKALNVFPTKLIRVDKGQSVIIQADSLTRELLDTNKCFVLDCGIEIFVWMGRSTPLEDRKKASSVAEELLRAPDRQKANITRVIEGFETVGFRLKFDSWPVISSESVAVSEDSRGRVAAALKRQGFNVKGMVKAAPVKEEIQPHIDCTGNLQVWRVDGEDKKPLQASEQSKFYTGDCYIFQYAYTGEGKEEILIGTWFGQKSIKEERSAAILLATKMAESLKFQAAQARIYEGKEPPQFFAIFQSFIVYKGGVSSGYKNYISEKGSVDDTYSENGIALFRVQGSGPENMQAIQVEPLAASLNSSYCFILHSGDTVLTWIGGLATSGDQELVERQLDLIKPNLQAKPQKEGNESEQFWKLLGGKHDYRSQKVSKHVESDPHLFSCSFIKGNLKVAEIFNFTQDDLMTEEIFVLDCYSDIFVWIGQQVDSNSRVQALNIADKFLEYDFLLEKLSREAPIFIIFEDNEPPFFTRFFKWDNSKSGMHGNSFQRKLSIIKYGVPPTIDKPKRRPLAAYGGRTGVPADKSQRSRSMSFSPERVRVIRGRSPAFNALAANFENLNARNLSTPPPVVRKTFPRSVTPDPAKLPPRASQIAALSSTFEPAKNNILSRPLKGASKSTAGSEVGKSTLLPIASNKALPSQNIKVNGNSASSRMETITIHEDAKEGEPEDDEGLPIFPYERLRVDSTDPVPEIDVTRRETYLSSAEFKEKLGMSRDAFFKLPKWKQNKLKMAIRLF